MSDLSHATTCREQLCRPARTSCARAKHKCPPPLCGSTSVLCCSIRQWFGSSVPTTVLSNHKMEASRPLQCSSVRILMFVAKLVWLDMRTRSADRTPPQSTVFSAHVIEHVVRSTYMLKSTITFVIQCLKLHPSFNGLLLPVSVFTWNESWKRCRAALRIWVYARLTSKRQVMSSSNLGNLGKNSRQTVDPPVVDLTQGDCDSISEEPYQVHGPGDVVLSLPHQRSTRQSTSVTKRTTSSPLRGNSFLRKVNNKGFLSQRVTPSIVDQPWNK